MDDEEIDLWLLALWIAAPGKWWALFWLCGWFG
jgi:hypothetical protein